MVNVGKYLPDLPLASKFNLPGLLTSPKKLTLINFGESEVDVIDKISLSLPIFFSLLCILNALVALYIYSVVPEFFMRFLVSFSIRVK